MNIAIEEILEQHKLWLKGEGGERADLTGFNLRGLSLANFDLRGVYLTGADLTEVNLDFSCLPLWCGGLDFKIDKRIARQIAYHLINLCNYSDIDVNEIISTVNESHLVAKHHLPKL